MSQVVHRSLAPFQFPETPNDIRFRPASGHAVQEIYVVSSDGNTLTATSKDTTEKEAVISETVFQWADKGPSGSHPISGSWRAYKTKRSKNGSIIKYKCTADAFSAETPLGEKYDGKFDGQFYPTEDDPGHTSWHR